MMDHQVRVVNKGSFEYRENYRGKMIIIPSGKHILMEYDDAVNFLGTMANYKRDKHGMQMPGSEKNLHIPDDDKIRIRELKAGNKVSTDKEPVYVCHACSKEFKSKPALMKHIKASHTEIMADDEARKELLDDKDLEDALS